MVFFFVASFWKKAITCARPEEEEDGMGVSLDRVRRLLEPILLRRTKDSLTTEGCVTLCIDFTSHTFVQ